LLEAKDIVRTNCTRALQNRRLEAVFESIAQGKLEPGEMSAILALLLQINEPLRCPCKPLDHRCPFGPSSAVIELGKPLLDWEMHDRIPQQCPRPSERLPLLDHMRVKPCINMINSDEATRSSYSIFIKAFEK
jgi:hypothetical protein